MSASGASAKISSVFVFIPSRLTLSRLTRKDALRSRALRLTTIYNLKKLFLLLPLLLLAFLSKAYYDTQTIEVRHFRIKSPALGSALKGLKIAHLSDLHIKEIGKREELVRRILDEEKPDLIFFTGDLIAIDGPYGPGYGYLKNLKALRGCYAILGNTEYYNENGSCILCHEKGSRMSRRDGHPAYLRNSSIIKRLNGDKVAFLGLDNPLDGKGDLDAALKGIPAGTPKVLLSHSPEVFREAAERGVDLVLSGHTHGGQWWGMKRLKRWLPLEPALEYLQGFFQKGRTLMYVNSGVGTSFLPFRFGVRPEVAFFQFKSSDGGNSAGEVLPSSPPESVFTGFSLPEFLSTFNVFPLIMHKVFHSDSDNRKVPSGPIGPKTLPLRLYDFESKEELDTLNWECHKWFEMSADYKSSGNASLKATLPPGHYPGISLKGFHPDWSVGRVLKMEVFIPGSKEILFHVRIDDHKSGWEYATRFDRDFNLPPGENRLEIPLADIKTNLGQRPLNLKKIERFLVFVPGNQKKIELYLDNIRLE